MSDRQLRVQHDETVASNRTQRLDTMQEAQRLADQRRAQQAARQSGQAQ